MICIVCADVHAIASNPGRRQLRELAERIVVKYPDSLRDQIGNDLVGSGSDSIFFQLEERLNNLNRGKGSARKRLIDAPELPVAKKPFHRDHYGCVSWQPPVPAGEEECLREKQARLKAMALSIDPDENSYDTDLLLAVF